MPGKQSERSAYDLAGNLIYQTNFNGVVITNQYDVMNRLASQTSANGYTVSCTYTATGQRQTMTDASGVTSYSYNNRDRLLLKTVSWNNGPTVSLNYAYDANGEVTNLWSSTTNGVNLVYNYDPLGRLTNVLANGSAVAGYGFDAVGNLQAMSYGNGMTNVYQYDTLNRLTNAVWKLNASTLASFYYQAGLTGNRTNLSETVNGTSRTYAWNYDSVYRMTNETISGIGNVGYGYDPVGNRTNRQSSISQLPTAGYIYNPNDWLTNTDQYDNNGSTTNSAGNAYQYDVMNHVTNVNNTIFITYNGDGNRASKTIGGTTTCYLLDDRNPSGYVQVLEEYQNSGLSRVYNYGLDLISQRTLSPQLSTNYFIYDGHGSTRLLTDIGGNVVNAFAYDAYGTLIASNAAPQTAYLYAGQQFDPDLGFYYLRARYLNPNTGRFWTMDTYAGNNQDPLSLHKYLYCEANPVNMTDPRGYASLKAGLGYDAEKAIDDEYLATHVGQKEDIEFGNWQFYSLSSYLKPDIMNSYPDEMHFLEIKPISASGVSKGVAKIILDNECFGPYYTADKKWQPRTSLLRTPRTGTTIFVINVQGIVFYQNIDELEMELLAAAVITTPEELLELLRFPQLLELEPALIRIYQIIEASLPAMEMDAVPVGDII
jgi:RHS repeat-associated protein